MIAREKSVLTGSRGLEPLLELKDFPVFFGCVEHPGEDDLRVDMKWGIEKETGMIQLTELVPLDVLYQNQHMDGTGATWQRFYESFAEYVDERGGEKMLEIGGGSGSLAKVFLERAKNKEWAMVEPNPLVEDTEKLRVIKGFFDESFEEQVEVDTVVFSHVWEHAYDPRKFLEAIGKYLGEDQLLVFAYPQIKKWLEKKFTNALNFEHTCFLTEYFVDYLLSKYGFEIVDKTYYEEHSIYYTAKRSKKVRPMRLVGKCGEYKKIFLDFVNYHREIVESFNKQLEDFEGEVYVFGAHIFTTYLLEFGLKREGIAGLLDNSKLKQGKRLYGYDFQVFSPEVLKGKDPVVVVLKVGPYRDEIYRQLMRLNPKTKVLE